MVTTDWTKIIEDKIKNARERTYKKRGWVKFTKSWLTSSINYRMELDEQAVFSKLIVMADEYGPVPGLISDNDFRAMPRKYLAHLATCPIETLETTLKKAIADDSIFENGHGLFLTHFDDYQFTEYDRQKPWRQEKKARELKYKKCPKCNYKDKTNEIYCPKCQEELVKDYKGGRLGHMVKE